MAATPSNERLGKRGAAQHEPTPTGGFGGVNLAHGGVSKNARPDPKKALKDLSDTALDFF